MGNCNCANNSNITIGQYAPSFQQRISNILGGQLKAEGIDTLMVNIGYKCNLACKHCHVEGSPANSLEMSAEDCAYVLAALKHDAIKSLDITGGAPELNPNFRHMVLAARDMGKHVIARTNLTIFFEPGNEDLAEFYAANKVEVIASMPCYTQANVDGIRGAGVFDKSIKALKQLNALGYGKGTGLALNLVYNPTGAFLPGQQQTLEADYKRELAIHGITFDKLFAFTNMPSGRFRKALEASGELVDYEQMLQTAFNPETLGRLMCRRLLSVAPDGTLHDCDFNQADALGLQDGLPSHIRDFNLDALAGRTITVAEHCYGCTAGQGST